MPQESSAHAVITELGERWVKAELRGDGQALDQIAARDFTLVGPVGFVLDRAQWIDRYSASGALRMQAIEWSDMSIRQYGDAAVVIGVQTQRATYAGKPADGKFRVTQACVREDGAWKIASLHFSPIGGPPPFSAAVPVHAAAADGGDG
jgi:hypothetical protein